jgi:hypothetical protein
VALRGKAMECVGLIGEAVGDEAFENDAIEVMDILLTAMVSAKTLGLRFIRLFMTILHYCLFTNNE